MRYKAFTLNPNECLTDEGSVKCRAAKTRKMTARSLRTPVASHLQLFCV
jgi:hypothetical protein